MTKNELGRKVKVKKRYTMEEQIEALRILKENDYNFIKTSANLKVAVNTLRGWNDKYRSQIDSDPLVANIAAKTETNMMVMKQQFLSRHFEDLNTLTKKTIGRALAIVDNEGDLNKLTNALKAATEVLSKLVPVASQDDNSITTINLIQQSINQCNALQDSL